MALLALAAADDFADARRQHVHGGHRSAIVVAAHVERFDAFRIIGHDHRLVEHFLGKVAFMLALHVHAPLGGDFASSRMASVYVMRSKLAFTRPSSVLRNSGSYHFARKSRSAPHAITTCSTWLLRNASARS